MNLNLSNQAQTKTNPIDRKTRAKMRADTVRMLRELAFVLKMTQRVRAEIETEEKAEELVPA